MDDKKTKELEKGLLQNQKKRSIYINIKADIKERWREYFQKLLGHQTQTNEYNTIEAEIENARGDKVNKI